jgi:SAM-dependent methyltransferase
MPGLLYINLFFLLVAIALVGYFVLQINSLVGEFAGNYDFITSRRAVKLIAKIVYDYGKAEGVFYDLGCSRGRLALGILRSCPGLKIYGIDNSGLKIIFSKSKAFALGRTVNFSKGDIFAADVSNADVVYIYLDQFLLPKLQAKLRKELKPEAIVITNSVFFPKWQPLRTYVVNLQKPEKEKMFVYKNI